MYLLIQKAMNIMNAYYAEKLNKLVKELAFIKMLGSAALSSEQLNELKKDGFNQGAFNKYNSYFGFKFVGNDILFNVEIALNQINRQIAIVKKDYLRFPSLMRVLSCDNGEGYCTHTYYVKATSASEAVALLHKNDFEVYGRRINSPYDCTGQWFSYGVHMHDVRWSHALKCYVVPVNWSLDI